MGTMSLAQTLAQYRQALAADVRFPFLRPRRFTSAESWTKAATVGGVRYAGMIREYEPDLPNVLTHERILILGEPGAGKSTTAKAVVAHCLADGQLDSIPVFAFLKSYQGSLRALLDQRAPASLLNASALRRVYVFDGIDEVPAQHRDAFRKDLNELLTVDPHARLVVTSRQAFHALHQDAFPSNLTIYHLLDFDDSDIRACAANIGVDPAAFIAAAESADCAEEIHNPFIADVMLARYRSDGKLSPLRSDNVEYMIGALIRSRPTVNASRQRRALRMLAIACEVAARNELSEAEALRVLLEAIDVPEEAARQLLDELSHSILIRTAAGISFQMRSYGEYLAAEELMAASIERVRELVFIDNAPVDSWLNSITYLAELNETIKRYFLTYYPRWLLNVSPFAFTETERTTLTRRVLDELNRSNTYVVANPAVPSRRMARLLTSATVVDLQNQLTSTKPHERANALVLLSIRRDPLVLATALPLATAALVDSSLRQSALIALINQGDPGVIGPLLAVLQRKDPLYIHMIDVIGSVSTPADFPMLFPLLAGSNAIMSATYYHCRELNTSDALTAVIDYLKAHPDSLDGNHLDAYIEPMLDLIPRFWNGALNTTLGEFLSVLNNDTVLYLQSRLLKRILDHLQKCDCDGAAVRVVIAALQHRGKSLGFLVRPVAPLVNLQAGQWIIDTAPRYIPELVTWIEKGPIRDLFTPYAEQTVQAQEALRAEYIEEERRREEGTATVRTRHQSAISTNDLIDEVIEACELLPRDHWPEVTAERRIWLSQRIAERLTQLDLAHSVQWKSAQEWTQPRELWPLLHLVDYYQLRLVPDVPIALALAAWHDRAISNYYRREGFTPEAQNALIVLLQTATNNNIIQNVLGFIGEAGYKETASRAELTRLAVHTAGSPQVRLAAIEILVSLEADIQTLITLHGDQDPDIRERAFCELVRRQHEPTVRRALATLSEQDLQNGEVSFPSSSSLDWLGTITAPFALEELRALRRRSVTLRLWRVASLVTAAIGNIDKPTAASTIREQLGAAPPEWQNALQQDADQIDITARIAAAQQAPFDLIIKKLKGATSMIRVKVWCEGSTDRPVFRKLFTELGEFEISETLDFVGGWGGLLSESEPERWLDGCRQAIVVMDGDVGRKLNKRTRPLTNEAKTIVRRFAKHPLKLHVLRRYAIENYFPRNACEAVLGRDLAAYFPLPETVSIEVHFCDPQPWWRAWVNCLRRRHSRSFYRKSLNEDVSARLTLADIEGTDLADILLEINRASIEARRF
ncbi:MAG: hypothetical protein ABSH56_00045 [Bryobacteraceae bacterium]|jgi:hypothetical protein